MLLVDTGGIEPYSDDIILKQMRRQAQLAIDSADVIIIVTDVRSGVVSTDREVASMLQKSGKPIVLCVNKCDTVGEPPAEYYEFYNLGLGDPIAVSSVHGMGTGDLLDAVCEYLPPAEENEEEDDTVKVAVIGKPNVGKSSLVNAILGEDRMIVSDIAGTTRDATDSYVENKYGKFVFIDTAGLRRKSRVYDSIEKYSVIRARMAVERAQVCVIMIDAVEGFTEQDSKVAGIAHELGKACIIAVNKWDAVEALGVGVAHRHQLTVLDREDVVLGEHSVALFAHLAHPLGVGGVEVDGLRLPPGQERQLVGGTGGVQKLVQRQAAQLPQEVQLIVQCSLQDGRHFADSRLPDTDRLGFEDGSGKVFAEVGGVLEEGCFEGSGSVAHGSRVLGGSGYPVGEVNQFCNDTIVQQGAEDDQPVEPGVPFGVYVYDCKNNIFL